MIGVGRLQPRGELAPIATSHDAEHERACWIGLSLVPGLGPAGFAELLARYGTAAAAWSAGPDAFRDLPRLPKEALAALRDLRRAGPERVAGRLAKATRAAGGRIVTALDSEYPPAMSTMVPRPPVLHVAGDDAALQGQAVAIVGTRRPSGYGLSCAIEIADEMARAGVTVASGLALGIDGAAHRAAVAAGGRSVAVLPSPLDRIYPPRHGALAREIIDGGGALVSELAPGRVVGRPDFARRNRIIAGLAVAVIVVEAPDRSGALLTAAAAIALGRELFAVPGPIDAASSRGCNRLIADQHASIVTSAVAVMQQIGVRRGLVPPSTASLSEPEGLVLGNLLRRSGSIEELIDVTGLGAGEIAGALTLLEARGLVSSFGGATFHASLAARRIAQLV
jgi:DNA processing protein